MATRGPLPTAAAALEAAPQGVTVKRRPRKREVSEVIAPVQMRRASHGRGALRERGIKMATPDAAGALTAPGLQAPATGDARQQRNEP